MEGRRGPESELEEDAEEGESVAPDIAPEATICMCGVESCELIRRKSDEAKSGSRAVGSPPSANCFSSPRLVPTERAPSEADFFLDAVKKVSGFA